MYRIDNQSRFAVYSQIVDQVEKYILVGVLKVDDKMPPVRKMSVDLSVNPNTVQKAYTELERKGITYSIVGKGSFVSGQALEIIRSMKRENLVRLKPLIHELAISGVSEEEVVDYIKQIFASNNEEVKEND